MGSRLSVRALLLVLASSCGGAAETQPAPAHPAPFVHHFTDPAQWSKKFDDPARDAWQRPAEVVSLLRIAPGTTVADVGAGTGYFEPYLSRAVGPAGVVFAVDVEPEMVRWLEDRSARDHWGNVRPQLGDTSDPKLPAGRVDRVLIVDTWHHIAERIAYARKVRAGLAPGGTLAIVEFTLDSPEGPPKQHRIAPAALIDELRAAGFTAEQVTASLPYQYVVVAH
jgi:predicted methyltransferase